MSPCTCRHGVGVVIFRSLNYQQKQSENQPGPLYRHRQPVTGKLWVYPNGKLNVYLAGGCDWFYRISVHLLPPVVS